MSSFTNRPCKYPVRESNPYRRLEGPASSTVRRTGHVGAQNVPQVDREALESSSAVLQTAAIPSQLPIQILYLGRLAFGGKCLPEVEMTVEGESRSKETKKARCRCDTGLWSASPNIVRMSQAQGVRQTIRRLIDKSSLTAVFANVTRTYQRH